MKFNVTYNGRTPGPNVGLVTGMITVHATDALNAMKKTYSHLLHHDPEIGEGQWEAMNFDVQPQKETNSETH